MGNSTACTPLCQATVHSLIAACLRLKHSSIRCIYAFSSSSLFKVTLLKRAQFGPGSTNGHVRNGLAMTKLYYTANSCTLYQCRLCFFHVVVVLNEQHRTSLLLRYVSISCLYIICLYPVFSHFVSHPWALQQLV